MTVGEGHHPVPVTYISGSYTNLSQFRNSKLGQDPHSSSKCPTIQGWLRDCFVGVLE